MKKKLLRLAAVISLLISTGKEITSFPITNFTASHEHYYWRSAEYSFSKFHEKGDPQAFRLNFGSTVDWGFSPTGYNKEGDKVDPYSIYSSKENIFPSNFMGLSQAAKDKITGLTNLPVLRALFIDPQDNSFAGNFVPKSTIKEWNLNLFARLALPIESLDGQFEVSAYLPIKYVKVQTKWSFAPVATEAIYPPAGALTLINASELLSIVGIDSDSGKIEFEKFEQNGFGDLTLLASWKNHFTQVNSELSSVGVYVQSGITLPTSKKVDPLNILAYSFGNDNSITLPFGGAININFAKNFRISAAANGVFSLSETSERLLKTDAKDTELFLHSKMLAQRSPGAQISMASLAEVISECKKYRVGIMYHFMKKYEDKFTSTDVNFVPDVVNKMEKYQERVAHHVIARVGADLSDVVETDLTPSISLSYRHPFRATRIQAYKILQVEFALNF